MIKNKHDKKGISFLNRAITPAGSLRPFPLVIGHNKKFSPLCVSGSGQNRGKNRRFRTFRLAFLSQKRKEAGVSFGVPGKGKKVSMIKRNPAKNFWCGNQ